MTLSTLVELVRQGRLGAPELNPTMAHVQHPDSLGFFVDKVGADGVTTLKKARRFHPIGFRPGLIR